jgi:hypothetical protein
MSEIDASVLKCNSCWATLGVASGGATGDAFKTACNHLFCGPCTARAFQGVPAPLLCPLCDMAVEDVHRLSGERSMEHALRVFAFSVFYPEDALRLVSDAAVLARTQTALYGTREGWVKAQEGDGLKRRLTEADNRINSMAVRLRGCCCARRCPPLPAAARRRCRTHLPPPTLPPPPTPCPPPPPRATWPPRSAR